MANGVLVFGEATEDKRLAGVTAEVLGAARRLAETAGGPVTCALLGLGVEGLAKEVVAFGADKAIVVHDPLLADYQGDAYV
ncbi:MAG: electron transfer flavoprotein subunit alpha/FixB family protein, partial [Dehalococcoidia bacterium]